MKIALAVWSGRISPVFDWARQLLLVETSGAGEVSRSRETIEEAFPPSRVRRLRELGASVLICGAVSRPLAALIAASGIRLIPFVDGDVESVLAAYLAGRLPDPRFSMPGCGATWGRGRMRRGGFRRRRGFRGGRWPQ